MREYSASTSYSEVKMARKISPEMREKIRRTNEEGLKARAQLQATLDRVAESQRLWAEAREQKQRSLLRRVLRFGRAA
jgi:prephenate dehydrogenase